MNCICSDIVIVIVMCVPIGLASASSTLPLFSVSVMFTYIVRCILVCLISIVIMCIIITVFCDGHVYC